jgi:hypothetical protein
MKKTITYLFLAFVSKANCQISSQTYTTPGSYTFTVPLSVTSITAEVIGAGGDGFFNGAGGGGGGGYASGVYAVVPSSTLNVEVGVAGSGSLLGTSSVGSFISASGGENGFPSFDNTIIGGAGAGGVGTGGTIANRIGGSGGNGCYTYYGGGGGGAAGPLNNGTNGGDTNIGGAACGVAGAAVGGAAGISGGLPAGNGNGGVGSGFSGTGCFIDDQPGGSGTNFGGGGGSGNGNSSPAGLGAGGYSKISWGTCAGPQPTTVWTGAASTTDWFDNNNWSNCAPGPITDATIPVGAIVLINSSTADVKSLTIDAGALLQISSNETINVYGDFTNNGTFNAGVGLVNFVGSVPQQISGTTNTSFYNLLIGQNVNLASNSTDVLNILTINSGSTFNLNAKSLVIYGSIANTAGEIKGDNVATLSLNGTGNMGTLRFAPSFEKLAGLNISIGNAGITPGVIALGSNLVIDALNPFTNLNLVNGGINLNGYNLSSSPTTFYYGGPTSIVYGHPNSILDIQSILFGGNLNMDATANSLKALILNSGGILDLGSQLNILDSVKVSNGTLNTNGFLTLKSTANLKARIADCSGGNISGNVTVETFAPGGITDWSVLGVSGILGQTFNEWYGQIPMTIEGSATGVTSAGGLYFESVQGWDEPSNDYDTTITVTSPITLGKGYWVYLGDNLGSTGDLIWSVTGSPFIGNLTYPVDGALSGFNLVSNPYASPISWAKVLAESNLIIPGGLDDAIYIYNPDLGLTTSYVTGVSSHPNGANDVIPMGQGFYVKSNGYSLLQYTEATKVANNTNANPLLRSATIIDPSIGTVLRLKVEGEGYSDYTAIRFHSNASTSFDTKLDAHKLYDSPGYAGFPGTWTKRTVIATQTEGIDYSVNSLPYATIQNAVIPVIVRVYTTGQYTISSSDFANLQADGNACVVLKDKLTNSFHDLTTGDYVFKISDTTQAARFELTICAKESVTTSTLTTGIKPNSGSLANAVFISKDAKGIFANLNFNKPTNATISVTNVLGQKIIDSKKVRVKNETVYLDVNTSDQLIFVTVETETEKVTKKFLNFN